MPGSEDTYMRVALEDDDTIWELRGGRLVEKPPMAAEHYQRTLTAWRRRPDGSYSEEVFHGGVIRPVALPNVTVDLDVLFG
jgi:hypothetical protein